MRSVWCATLIAALALGAAGCPPEAGGKTGGEALVPPVVLITVDGLVPEQLSLFGGPQGVPNLERLASGGGAWADAWTASPMSRPAVATYLTGLAPDRHLVRDDLFTALPSEVATLPALLAPRGYRSAAFPGSSLLGQGSGLLRDFDIVDAPPSSPPLPGRWIARVGGEAQDLASDGEAWLESVPPGSPYFAWFHFAHPGIALLTDHGRERPNASNAPGRDDGEEPTADLQEVSPFELQAETVQAFDDAVGRLIAALESRGDLDGALIVVAGTFADVSGGEAEPPGAGFSVMPAAVSVPVVADFPEGRAVGRSAGAEVWAPDVPRTIAELAGVELPVEAEGVPLTAAAPAERPRFSWSWATLDQMGWRPLRAVGRGDRVRVEGGVDPRVFRVPGGEALDPDSLAGDLASRADPAAARLDLETVGELLEGTGIDLQPVPEQGRDFGPAESRREAAALLWNGRAWTHRGSLPKGLIAFGAARDVDPEAKAPLLDRAQGQLIMGSPRASRPVGRMMTMYPTDPEVLHWYAHSLWGDDLDRAERVLLAVLPHKDRDADVLYDLACARSLAEDLEAAETYLDRALQAGFDDWKNLETDSDLRALRESGVLSRILREYRQ